MSKSSEYLPDAAPRFPRLAIVLFLLLVTLSLGVGYWIYLRQTDLQEQKVNEALSRAAQVRANQIASTVHERLGDARLGAKSPFLREKIASWRQHGRRDGDDKQKVREYLAALKSVYGYIDAAIAERGGNILISAENSTVPVDDITTRLIDDTVMTKSVRLSSIRAASLPQRPRRIVEIVSPVWEEGIESGMVAAVLLLRFDADRHIYPWLQFSSFPNLPNDAMLVEVRGGKVFALSDSRLCNCRFEDVLPIDAALLSQQLPRHPVMPKSTSFNWKARTGWQIAADFPVDGLSWHVITMVPESASDALVLHTAMVAMAVSAVMLLILGLGAVYWWKYRESELKFLAVETENRRRLAQRQYEYLSQYANDMIILANGEYHILSANEKTVQVFGYTASELAGQHISMLSPDSARARLDAHLEALRRDSTALFEIEQRKRDGSVFPVEISARTIDLEGKRFSQFICRDITERKEAERKIHSLAYYDSVTKLPNRALLNDRLEQGVHLAARTGKKVGILFMDLDNFKNINDSLGHQIGDELLHAVGQRLAGCVREVDTVARIGGDEFLVMLPNLDAGEEAHHVAKKVIASFDTPFLLRGHHIYTSTSVGISIFPDDAADCADLVRFADSALYEAKGRGRNTYRFFTRELNDEITRAASIENYLRQAMESGDLCLWYQPQVDARNGRIIGAEALLRARDGTIDHFTPSDFVAIAEERGLIAKLGEWTLREACRQSRVWKMQGLNTVPIAVNVSAIQFKQKEFSESVLRILSEFGMDASCIELEITETAIMGRVQEMAELTVRLRQSGVRMSIDDFGTGYSNLSYLKHIPIDKIKIDRTFILDMLSDTEDETITQAIIKMAQGLRMRVIAEGVEQPAQMERLLSFGCHEAQGFLYSEAVSPDTFGTFLEREKVFAAFT